LTGWREPVIIKIKKVEETSLLIYAPLYKKGAVLRGSKWDIVS